MDTKTHIIDGKEYIECDCKADIGDYVISSEQIGIPRIYEVYFVTKGRTVLGKYCRGHTNLHDYKVLKSKLV